MPDTNVPPTGVEAALSAGEWPQHAPLLGSASNNPTRDSVSILFPVELLALSLPFSII